MKSLFDDLVDEVPRSDWTPVPPPPLDGIDEIYLNFETTGLKWFDGDRPIAASLCLPDGQTFYLPWGHRGGNLDEAVVKEWAHRELRGKLITNINTRFDIHMAREWGVDLEAQGNRVSDVGHYAALLDDHRKRFRVDELIPDILGEEPMRRLDESRMVDYHAGEAAPRSMYGVDAVRRLKAAMWPQLTAENLQPVRALEDKVIYVVCEMEKNGSPIDVELLDKWIKKSQEQVETYLWQLAKEVGFQVNPDSPKDQEKVFRHLHLDIERTGKGAPSFTDAILKRIEHPTIKLMRKAGKLISLRSKFLVNTKQVMGSDGILRYAFNQLKSAKDENADRGEAGTVTGRFSSTKITEGVGCNIQQRMKAAKQRIAFGYDEDDNSHDDEIFVVRKLHIAGSGFLLSSDMDQAQYRIFAHYVNNADVIAAYQADPTTSFHKYMWNLIKPYADLSYRQQKDLDFAYIFGAGLTKMSLMLDHITVQEYNQIKETRNYHHPNLEKTQMVKDLFEREVPELRSLLDLSMHIAKPECDVKCNRYDKLHKQKIPHYGYVRTFLGRRGRFPEGQRIHKAFNMVDQGTEADYMKTKLVELHEMRKETNLTLRITNHDEIVADSPDKEHAKKVDKILNYQSFNLRVPLTWSTGIGPNWADTEAVESQFEGAEATRAKQNITDLHFVGQGGSRGE